MFVISYYRSIIRNGENQMKKKFFSATISLLLCVCMISGSIVGVSAGSFNAAEIIGAITGVNNSGANVNLSQLFADYLKEATSQEKESVIDKLVENIKNKFNGTENPDTDVEPEPDEDESVTLDKGAASNIAELFNITVNELKKGTPGYNETVNVSVSQDMSGEMANFAGVLAGLFESLIGDKDTIAGIIGGIEKETTKTTKYPTGADVKNNLPVSSKDYVACLETEDIKDYSITIYRSGAYKMHIDLHDVEGSAAQSGLAHVFNTTDKAFATVQIGSSSINIYVKLKYVNNYVECQVDRNGNITRYTMNTGVTFLFMDPETGEYSPEMPYFGVNFEKEGIVYTVNTEYSGFNFATRAMGDANNDGKINSTDARLVLRASGRLETLDAVTLPYCDVTGDKKVSAADAREILRASAQLTSLPTTEDVLGIKEYTKDEKTQAHIDDLLILLMAYEAAADAEAQKELQNSYNDKYNGTDNEETTGELNTPSNKVEDVLDFIGGIIGGKK